jgi:hypothetical protein
MQTHRNVSVPETLQLTSLQPFRKVRIPDDQLLFNADNMEFHPKESGIHFQSHRQSYRDLNRVLHLSRDGDDSDCGCTGEMP